MPQPEPPPLIVSAADVAREMGLPQPLDEDTRWTIEQAIRDAQADVAAYLGRDSLTPVTYTDKGRVSWMGRYELTHHPVIEIVSEVAEVDPLTGALTGLMTVTYTAGIDAAGDPALEPIRRFVRAHAIGSANLQALRRRALPGQDERLISSLSVDGQSVAYEASDREATAPGSGAPGALPRLETLDRWRIAGRRVSKRRTTPADYPPWPYDYSHDRWWW